MEHLNSQEIFIQQTNQPSHRFDAFFQLMRQIELSWPTDAEESDRAQRAYRKLMLLHPRLSYQATRQPSIRSLTQELQRAIVHIGPNDRIRLQRLMEYFEAVLAFYIS